ncbi:MAG: pyridoxamine 5'-phosphate oxidase family protein [Syntrophobacteraceae bacterium]
MLDKMKAILKESSMCVLATCSENKPHCSLMAYVTDEQAVTLYIVTLKASRKYINMMQNPHVSLLVDSRANDKGEPGSIKALTVSGISSPLRDQTEKESVLTRLVQNHPHLRELIANSDAEVVAIRVESFLLLDGPTKAHFVRVRE